MIFNKYTKMIENRSNPLIEKTLKFALDIIEFCELLEEKRKFIIAKQLLRSVTSIGANAHEAQNPSSKNDFIHKMKITAKEIEETKFWLYLCKHSKTYPFNDDLEIQITEISKIVYKILSTSLKK